MTNHKNGTLYIGVTSDISRRVFEHQNDLIDGFSKRYRLHVLVYAEIHNTMEEAIKREKQLKNWHRDWKISLIEKANPHWCALEF